MNPKKINHNVWETDSKTLDNVWQNWNCQVGPPNQVFQTYYTDVLRSSQRAHRFEDWLYEHGAFVIQKNHKRFIRFHNEEDAIMFLLRWG